MRANGDGTRWALVWQVTAAWFLWTWFDIPPDPAGESALAAPVLILLVAALPAGLVVAALTARFARPTGGAVTWIVAFGYGVWLGGWTTLLATSAGILECNPPDCRSTWGPRVVTFVAALVVVRICAWVEGRLRRRWATAPS